MTDTDTAACATTIDEMIAVAAEHAAAAERRLGRLLAAKLASLLSASATQSTRRDDDGSLVGRCPVCGDTVTTVGACDGDPADAAWVHVATGVGPCGTAVEFPAGRCTEGPFTVVGGTAALVLDGDVDEVAVEVAAVVGRLSAMADDGRLDPATAHLLFTGRVELPSTGDDGGSILDRFVPDDVETLISTAAEAVVEGHGDDVLSSRQIALASAAWDALWGDEG